MCKLRTYVLCTVALATTSTVNAGPGQVEISGDVTAGPLVGSTFGVTQTYLNPAEWTYWTFSANAGDEISWGVRRLAADFDPVASVVEGNLAGAAFSMDAIWDSTIMGAPLMSYSDDTAPPNVPGPFGDPFDTFIAPSTGVYTICVAVVTGIGENPFEVYMSGSSVPAPAAAALLGVAGTAALRRRRSSAAEISAT